MYYKSFKCLECRFVVVKLKKPSNVYTVLCKIIRPPAKNGLFRLLRVFSCLNLNFIPTKLYIIGKEILSSICFFNS